MEVVLITLWAAAALAGLALAVHHLTDPQASSGSLGLVAVASWVLAAPVAALGFVMAATSTHTRGRVAMVMRTTSAVCLAAPLAVMLAAAWPPAVLINAVRARSHRRHGCRPRDDPDSGLD